MFTSFTKINFTPIMNNYNFENRKSSIPMQKDVFIKQHTFAPSFGSAIPSTEIMNCCDVALLKLSKAKSTEDLITITKDIFYTRLRGILYPTNKNGKLRKKIPDVLRKFRHEITAKTVLLSTSIKSKNDFINLINDVCSEAEISSKGMLGCQKDEIIKRINTVKDTTNMWVELESWTEKPSIPIATFLNRIKKLMDCSGTTSTKIEGKDLLKGKRVRNPLKIYYMFSQPILNAQKYGEGKPFKVKIKKGQKPGLYYFYVINEHTRPIPDDEIDKILKGRGYRARNTKNIQGTGQGFSDVIKLLKFYYKDELLQTIHKGKSEGVSVRIPFRIDEKKNEISI